MNQPLICSDPDVLAQLQFILWFGFFVAAGAWLYFKAKDNDEDQKKVDKKKQTDVYCPLHRTDRERCEDKHKD